jgi:hypothetical protein
MPDYTVVIFIVAHCRTSAVTYIHPTSNKEFNAYISVFLTLSSLMIIILVCIARFSIK